MIQIKVKVTSFTKKILTKDFGSIIKIDRRNLLYPIILSAVATKDWVRANDNLEIIVPSQNLIHTKPGISFQRFCQNKMLEFILAQVYNGEDALKSLKNFYLLYDLDEDDYPLASAYRSFQRFISRKNNPETSKKNSINVVKNWTVFSIKELEQLLGVFTLTHFNKHVASRNHFKANLVKQSRIYIYHRIGLYSVKQISSMMNIPPDTIYKILKRYHKKVIKDKIFPFPDESLIQVSAL